MAGYKGYSMSNNAVAAYADGEKPKSKWTKSVMLDAIKEAAKEYGIVMPKSIDKLKKDDLFNCYFKSSSWHHTSKEYNKTIFYSLASEWLEMYSEDDIKRIIEESKAIRKEKQDLERRVKASWIEWKGTRRHPKAIEHEGIGTIRGDWFFDEDGGRHKVSGKYFEYPRRVELRREHETIV